VLVLEARDRVAGRVWTHRAPDGTEIDWAEERWARGCFMAHMPPGVITQLGRALRTPVGRIHWAGSEMATVSHGSIDGAIRSGELAAAEVLAAG